MLWSMLKFRTFAFLILFPFASVRAELAHLSDGIEFERETEVKDISKVTTITLSLVSKSVLCTSLVT